MEISTRLLSKCYELVPLKGSVKSTGLIIFHRRIIVGRGDSCDLVINSSSVSVIHAVIEISNDGGRIYDMKSDSGTRVNDKKILCQDIKIGDKISFGAQEFYFKEYEKAKDIPLPIGSRNQNIEKDQDISSLSPPVLPGKMPLFPRSSSHFEIDPRQIIKDNSSSDTPYISYPLSKDPNTEFSEYIFEDARDIYPIFKWSIDKMAAEVIIIHKDKIISVDYLSSKKESYFIKGLDRSSQDIEFPYLKKNESLPFIRVNDSGVSIENSLGFEGTLISDDLDKAENFLNRKVNFPVLLIRDEILKLQENDLQIFVRNSESPPQIKPAPIFRRHNDSKKYFIFLLVFMLAIAGALSRVVINKEIEKEKEPERLATIIYNKNKFVYKKKKIPQTKHDPKSVEKKKVEVKPKPKPKRVAKPTPAPKPKPKRVAKPTPAPKPKPKRVAKPTPAPKPKPKRVAKPTPAPKPKPKRVAKPTPAPKPKPKRVAKPTPAPKPKPKPVAKRTPAPKRRPSPSKNPIVAKKSGSVVRKTRPKSTKPPRATRSSRKSRRSISPSKGHVEAYRPSNKFSGSLSKLLAKGGGSVSGVESERLMNEDIGGSILGGDSEAVETISVAKSVGSLSGASRGKLDSVQGTEGLVSKKGIAVAGIPSETVVLGDYDASRVSEILRRYLSQFRACYQRELDRRNKVSGKVSLNFHIGSSGFVSKAGVSSSELPSSVEGCVLNVLKGIRFPAPLGGGVVAIKQPMYFEARTN